MTDTRTTSARRTATTPPGGRTGSTPPGRRTGKAPTGSWPVRERSLVSPVLGIPPGAAVAVAGGLTAVGVVADLLRIGTVGVVFEIAYFLGCVLAVAWVRRRGLFLPAIQPPLLLAVVIPVIAVLVGAPTPEAGVADHLLMAGAPLVNAFPAMAFTTAAVLLLAGFRLVRQRTGPDDAVGLLRRRLARGRSEDAGRSGAARPGRAPAAASAPRTDRGRPRSGGDTGSGGHGSGRGRRTGAPEAPRASGTPTGGARTPGGSGRAAPRGGGSRASAGSERADEPARSRRPRRS